MTFTLCGSSFVQMRSDSIVEPEGVYPHSCYTLEERKAHTRATVHA